MERYEKPKAEVIIFEGDEEAETIIASIDGSDIIASWLRGEA